MLNVRCQALMSEGCRDEQCEKRQSIALRQPQPAPDSSQIYETTHSSPRFPPEGRIVLLLKIIGEEIEETNEKQQRRCIGRCCQGQTHSV